MISPQKDLYRSAGISFFQSFAFNKQRRGISSVLFYEGIISEKSFQTIVSDPHIRKACYFVIEIIYSVRRSDVIFT